MEITHEHFMRRCLELASQAKAKGNIPVGSVIMQNNIIVAEAEEELPSGLNVAGHAEILVVQRSCEELRTTNLSDCILYSTTEPCWMCSYAIRDTRIGTVVLGTMAGEIGGIEGKYPILTDGSIQQWSQPPTIIRGILQAECEAIRK